MGWTGLNAKPASVRDYLVETFTDHHTHRSRVIDCAIVGLRAAYLAVEETPVDGPSRVTGLVVQLAFRRSGYDRFLYKDIVEFWGPTEDQCPRRILERLSPLNPEPHGPPRQRSLYLGPHADTTLDRHAHARDWRRRCWENVHKREGMRGMRRLGTRLRARDGGIDFGAYGLLQDFEVREGPILLSGRKARPALYATEIGARIRGGLSESFLSKLEVVQ